ncbi:hypothetical protein Plim_2858 [Planctopirus limnophila DSM 3776]|uniref:Uncharacterized protein n=1 Tax=Planctopirus limnophila (strain ATCC 43296 / DSM 3776 / IFAM 1008 / Mu 290) TaxID=521674 RepID=D5SRI7_PLAL2|nr:hypothetical protein Plim_2858 [Planctopirus limnophila DSM 3776]
MAGLCPSEAECALLRLRVQSHTLSGVMESLGGADSG